VVVGLVLVFLEGSLAQLKLVLLPDEIVSEVGSRCLDGSNGGYYFQAATKAGDKNKWVFFMEGGGVCIDEPSCMQRAGTDLGSSSHWSSTFSGWELERNVLGSNSSINPFASWNHVYVRYCSGDAHTGMRKEAMESGLYTAGHLILVGILEHLRNTTMLSSATHVLVSGESAGGIGTFSNADFFSSEFPSAVVKASPQSGLYFPANLRIYPEWLLWPEGPPAPPIMTAYVTAFWKSYVDSSCAAAHPLEAHQCWDASFLYPYVETPLFVAQNMFDSNQFEFLLCPSSATNFTQYQEYYGKRLRASVAPIGSNSTAKKDGLWVPSCFDHTQTTCLAAKTTVLGYHYHELLADWFFGNNSLPHHVVDNCPGPLPCNPVCGGC